MKYAKISIVLSIIGATLFGSGCASNADNNNPAIKVEVERVNAADGSRTFAYSGTIEESEAIPLSFSSVGTVSKVFVSEGAIVKKGQLLATLDNSTYQNAYGMVHATEQQAEDAYNRLTPMHKNGNLSEVKYVEVETGLKQAKAAAAIAKKNLDDCNLYAITDGYVGKRSIEPGMTAIPNLTSITIVKINKVFARIPVSENEISLIQKGQKAKIEIGALDHVKYDGIVEEIGVVADPLAHTYKIKIGIVNKDLAVKPGMICTAQIQTKVKTRGVIVPSHAVMVDETGKTFVYTVNADQKKAVRKYIQTGKLLNNGVEATTGVIEGELLVTVGQHKLVDNSLVEIMSK